ncbi:MAG: hypothetical protein G5Z42_02025 [Caldisphaeraceae archaeon]|nr:hypothetical protein [Caldisphaeraceae archaeon]
MSRFTKHSLLPKHVVNPNEFLAVEELNVSYNFNPSLRTKGGVLLNRYEAIEYIGEYVRDDVSD